MNDLLRIPPTHDLLTRFLRDRQRAIPVHEAARLVGWTRAAVRRQAKAEGVLQGERLPWDAVAGWLLDSWPLRTLFEILGPDSTLLPRGLRLLPVQWDLPAYIVHALRVQWQLEQLPHRAIRPAEFNDYLWDVLHRALDSETMAWLQGDHEFMDAYEYPKGGTE
jgi:hypothetical protein